MFRVGPPLTAPTMWDTGTISVSAFSVPFDAPALGSILPIDVDQVGDRLMMSVYRSGSLWTTHTINVDGRGAVRWYQISRVCSGGPNAGAVCTGSAECPGGTCPTTFTVSQWGNVCDPSLHFYYPSLMVNAAGQVAVGFSGSDEHHYVGCYFTGRRASDALGGMAAPQLLKEGEAAFNPEDTLHYRWGDYSSTTLDPVDQLTFWTIQEYAETPRDYTFAWGTWIAKLEFIPCGQPGHCNDGNECTVDSCLNGYCENKPSVNATACSAGLCCHGDCTPGCTINSDCNDENPCTTDTCADSQTCNAHCVYTWPACIASPGSSDGCCGPTCSAANDVDCNCGAVGEDKGPNFSCRDGIDNDCDGYLDCDDVEDCALDPQCACTVISGNNRVICVDWPGAVPPIRNLNFNLDLSESDNPGVTFVTGNDGWKVWSQVSRTEPTPANLGEIKINPVPQSTANFSVKVAHGTLEGAASVASISLVDSDWGGHSSLSGGSITGDLNGDLIVRESAGQGGVVSFTIGGDLDGDITIPKVNKFQVKGAVLADSTITLLGFVGGFLQITDFNTASGAFEGDLSFPNGIPAGGNGNVRIKGPLTAGASINFNGQALAGNLSLMGGAAAQSEIHVGPINGQLGLSNSAYAGIVNITSIGGFVQMLNTTLTSSIQVAGDANGTIEFRNGNFAPNASISISGNMGGVIRLGPGQISGDVVIGGNWSGSVVVIGDMSGDIYAAGNIISSEPRRLDTTGVMHGDLCAGNISASQPLPSYLSIGCGIGSQGTICGYKPVCPSGNLVTSSAYPPHGTKDARQPYPMGNAAVPLSARQGIGSPNPDARPEDKIILPLASTNPNIPTSEMRAISHDCWTFCETHTEPVDTGTPALSPNKISCVKETSDPTKYQIQLDRPISAKQFTTISYGANRVIYASLPGNINGDNWTNGIDLIRRIDCINGITSQCGTTVWTKDLDHSGVFAANMDYGIIWTDLWNGMGNFIAWQQTQLPANTCIGGGTGGPPACPQSPCGPDPGPMMAMGMGSEGGEESLGEEMLGNELLEEEPTLAEQNAVFAEWAVDFLATTDPIGSEAQDIFDGSVQMVTQWCVEFFTVEEKAALVGALSDPLLTFASQAGADAAAAVVAALAP